MEYTRNYELNKPELSEQYNLMHWNENMDKIDAQMKNEETTRTNQVSSLQTNLTNEINTRSMQVSSLQTNLTNEINTRSMQVSSLQDNLNSEATTRANQVSNLQNNLASEGTTRANADAMLQNLFVNSFLGMIQFFMRRTAPNGWVKCDGEVYSKSEYPAFWEAMWNDLNGIRSTTDEAMINEEFDDDGFYVSTNYVRVPKMTEYSEDGGYFLRGGTDRNIGKSQEDKIRDIKGEFNPGNLASQILADDGVFKMIDNKSKEDTDYNSGGRIAFDANSGNPAINPMAGHADGHDIHGASIIALPCVFVGVFS